MPPPNNEPVLERAGLGWRYVVPEHGVAFSFDRIVERRDELTAEMVATLIDGSYLLRRRVNLMGSRSLVELGRDLDELTGAAGLPWRRMLEAACGSVTQAYRRGPDLERYEGVLARPPAVSWDCDRLVMANVINTWIAPGSAGKSTLAAILCVAIGAGMPFLGRETRKGIALYLDWESTDEDFQEKLHDAAAGMGLSEVPLVYRLRMRGPLKAYVHLISELIHRLGITLVVVDAVAAAGGPMAEGNYEAVALDLESAVGFFPTVTTLLLDHVTGEDLRNGNAPVKARGSVRKTEFSRCQWTLSRDHEQSELGKHVVGFTHTKINRGRYEPQFGVEIEHGDGWVRAREIQADAVAPLVEKMSTIQRMRQTLMRNGPMEVKELALDVLGSDDERACGHIRSNFSRDHGKTISRLPDGRLAARNKPTLRVVEPAKNERNNGRNTRFGDDDEGVPF